MKDINTTFRREELEMLPTPELEKILFEELESNSTDRNSVLQLLSILEKRDPADQSAITDEVAGAWEKYLEDRDRSICDTPKVYRKPIKWLGAVAAVVVVVLTLLMTVPQAVGADSIFDIIGRWTQDIFGFFHESDPEVQPKSGYQFHTDNPGLQQIYDAVAAQGVTQPVVPTWIPEGYELVELKAAPHEDSVKIVAWLSDNNRYIVMSFEIYLEVFSNKYTKDKTDAEVYEHVGVNYYIASNNETIKAMWSISNVECFIELNNTDEMLKRIIRSIYE